jgi:hypothetical protein
MSKSTRLYANNAKTTLAAAVQPSDTTIMVANATLFPQPGAGEFFLATIDTGSTQEVIEVHGISGNSFINCVRGAENTVAGAYQAATRIENRATRGTYESFARLQDRMAPIASIDALSAPNNSDSNSYVTVSTDDGGNPIVAYTNGSSGIWAFANYPTSITSGTLAATGTTTSVSIANASTVIPQPFAGKYIIQFVTGANQGLARAITSISGNTVSWATTLPAVPQASDGYQVYQSEVSNLNALNVAANNGLIYAILLGS